MIMLLLVERVLVWAHSCSLSTLSLLQDIFCSGLIASPLHSADRLWEHTCNCFISLDFVTALICSIYWCVTVIFHFSTLLAALAEMEEATACEYQKWFGIYYTCTSLFCCGLGGVGLEVLGWGGANTSDIWLWLYPFASQVSKSTR